MLFITVVYETYYIFHIRMTTYGQSNQQDSCLHDFFSFKLYLFIYTFVYSLGKQR